MNRLHPSTTPVLTPGVHRRGRQPGRPPKGWRARPRPPADGRRHDRVPPYRIEIPLTAAGLAITAVAASVFVLASVDTEWRAAASAAWTSTAQAVVLTAVVSFLVYGNLVYQGTRLGYLVRRRRHRRATAAELDSLYLGPDQPLVILVPSYREEPEVIWQTLLSAALQEYPNKRVVLLIDDPPDPSSPEAARLLEAARQLPADLEQLLDEPAAAARTAMQTFRQRISRNPLWPSGRLADESRWLASAWRQAETWLEALADGETVLSHTDALFVEQVLCQAASECREAAEHLEGTPAEDLSSLWVGYRRLLARFEVAVVSFERKRYLNLSHEPNKAMNLNSYLSLLGGSWLEQRSPEGWRLVPVAGQEGHLTIPDADYVVTLDADSLLVGSYCRRLVHLLGQAGNERVAVAQSPYSAVPGASAAVERTAGATTDMQYLVHQGFTRHGATFWVGANALIRRAALDELCRETTEGDVVVKRYIQDRTVIEDTESSIDLIDAGWGLVNYPERLSFSATPPDFGSLVVQRRRWANGGLIILPKLVRHLVRRPRRLLAVGSWMRIHYLVSIAASNMALLLLLSVPFTAPPHAWWIPVSAAPYFALYGRDLHQAGYRYRDVVDVYALNLLLIPVNLAGVVKSLQQALTGTKIPFGRTPKVQGRTRVARPYLVAVLAMIGYWSLTAGWDALGSHWADLGYESFNVALLVYATGRFIRWADLHDDLRPRRRPLRAASARDPLGITASEAASAA